MKSLGGSSRTSSAGFAKLGFGLPLLLLALAAWVVLIGGLSAVRHGAGTDAVFPGFSIGYSWFVMAANFFVLALALIHIIGASVSFVAHSHSGIVALLAVVTVLDILETQRWNQLRKEVSYSTEVGRGTVTTFTGFICLAALNAFLILVLGNSASVRRGPEAEVYTTSTVHQNPAHHGPTATTTTPAATAV